MTSSRRARLRFSTRTTSSSPGEALSRLYDPRLEDRVADNNAKHDITESESLLFGSNFGVTSDIETGPNGNLYVVSISSGAVYQISRR